MRLLPSTKAWFRREPKAIGGSKLSEVVAAIGAFVLTAAQVRTEQPFDRESRRPAEGAELLVVNGDDLIFGEPNGLGHFASSRSACPIAAHGSASTISIPFSKSGRGHEPDPPPAVL